MTARRWLLVALACVAAGVAAEPPGAVAASVACPSASMCLAAHGPGILASTNPTGGTSAWGLENLEGTAQIDAISCPSTSLCVAADTAGNVLISTNPTGGAASWTSSNIDGTEPVIDVSCPSVSLCVAVDGRYGILASTDPTGGSSAWSAPVPIPPDPNCQGGCVRNVSCPTVTFCVAADGNDVWTSTTPTETWSAPVQILVGSLTALTCRSASLCLATDDRGDVLASTDPAGGAAAWSLAQVDGANGLTGVSCASPSLCVAVDGAGEVLTSTDPTGGAGTWSLADIDGTRYLDGVACASTSLCVALDSADRVAVSTNPTGGDWSVFGVLPGHLAASPTSLAFQSQAVGTAGAKSVNVYNTGGVSYRVGAAAVTGAGAGQLSVSTDGCSGKTLYLGDYCTLDVKFAPSATGTVSATLEVPSDDPGSPLTVPLSGTGVPPVASLAASPRGLAFPSRTLGSSFPPLTVVVTDTGTAAAHVGAASITGAGAGDYAVSSDTCTGTTIAISASCSVSVRFTPTSIGTSDATLDLPTDAPGSPLTVGLAGAAVGAGVGVPSLVWSDAAPAGGSGGSIARAGIDGSGVTQGLIDTSSTPGAVAQDAEHVYWVDSGSIARANLDGSDVDPSFISDVRPGSLALDSEHIYWTAGSAIGRANLDGSGVDQTYITIPNVGAPLQFVGPIAVRSPYVFFGLAAVSVPQATDYIGRANSDGTGVEPTLIPVESCTVEVLPADSSCGLEGLAAGGDSVYWSWYTEAQFVRTTGVSVAGLDGTPTATLFSSAGCAFGPSAVSGPLAVDSTYLYWTTGGTPGACSAPARPAIARTQLDGPGVEKAFIPDPNISDLGLSVYAPVGQPPPAASGGPPMPALSGLRLVGRRCVREKSRIRHHAGCRRVVAFEITYKLNRAAAVAFTIRRETPGWRVKGRCVSRTKKHTGHAHCMRMVAVRGSVAVAGRPGANTFTFTGRIGGHRLPAGRYRLIATPSAGGRTGNSQTVRIRILG
jgi:hypothetical protein